MGWGANGEDPLEVGPYVGVVEVGICVWAPYPADDNGDVAVEVEEASRCHFLPVVADCGDVVPIWLETLVGAEVDAGVFFMELLKLARTERGAFKVLEVAVGIKRLVQRVLTEGLIELDLDWSG